MIIDPNSISQSQIKSDLQTYIAGLPDAAKWADYFESSVGQTIVELISGYAAFITFQLLANRREVNLMDAKLLSSNIGISQNLGYSVFRGRNPVVTMTVKSASNVAIKKYQSLGLVKGQDIIPLYDYQIQNGVNSVIECVIGKLKTSTVTVPSSALDVHRFLANKVSSDIRLMLGLNEVPITDKIVNLTLDYWVCITNPSLSIDAFYLNQGTHKYTSGDILTLEYVVLGDTSFVAADMSFDQPWEVVADITDVDQIKVDTIASYLPPETQAEIKIHAPLYHETQFVVRGRDDYKKIFKTLDTRLIDTNGYDTSPAVVGLSYTMKNDETLTTLEKTALQTQLYQYTAMGVQPPVINDPTKINIALQIQLRLSDLSVIDDTIMADLNSLMDNYERKLGISFDFFELESLITDFSYIKVARLSMDLREWTFGTDPSGLGTFLRGYYVKPHLNPNGYVYYATNNGSTFIAEPTWPTAVVGEAYSTADGSTKTYIHTLAHVTAGVTPFSVVIRLGTYRLLDDGAGNLSGTYNGYPMVGVVNYVTGDMSITFGIAPTNSQAIVVDYSYGIAMPILDNEIEWICAGTLTDFLAKTIYSLEWDQYLNIQIRSPLTYI
jgi:hypothetical protein